LLSFSQYEALQQRIAIPWRIYVEKTDALKMIPLSTLFVFALIFIFMPGLIAPAPASEPHQEIAASGTFTDFFVSESVVIQ